MQHSNAIYQWIHTVDYEDFDLKVLAASRERPVLVDLWAEWCSPCQVIAPVLQRVIGEYDGRVHLAKVEVDAGEDLPDGAQRLGGLRLERGGLGLAGPAPPLLELPERQVHRGEVDEEPRAPGPGWAGQGSQRRTGFAREGMHRTWKTEPRPEGRMPRMARVHAVDARRSRAL